jgi:anti-sigma-K factor RskA
VITDLDHDELNGRAAAYVLGALDPAENAEFRAHLSECAPCASAVTSLFSVASALAHAAPPATPSQAVRDRVLERIASVDAAQPLAWPVPAAAAAPRDNSRTSRGSESRRRSLTRWLPLAAALLIAVALGVDGVRLRGRVASLEQRVRDIGARANTSEQELTSVRETAAEAQMIVVVLASSDLIRVDLAGQPSAPEARARAFWSRSRGLIFTASNLPPLPAGRTYQVWIVTPEAPLSAGLLRPGDRGDVHAVFTTPRDVARVAAVAVTIEPDGGVPAPTGEKYLVGLAN